MNRKRSVARRLRLIQRQARRRLFIEQLEERTLLAVFVVNSTANTPDSGEVPAICDTALSPNADPPVPASGICTLNAAISSANVNPGFDTIQFAIPGPGIPTIDISGFAFFIGPVLLDGSSQPAGTVELRGSTINLSKTSSVSSSGSTIRGFIFNQGGIGISSDNNIIVGNTFGLATNGGSSAPFTGGAISITGNNNVIGGSSASERNVIANYGGGISITQFPGESSSGNIVRGNYIGTNAAGNVAQAMTENGISVAFAPNTLIEGNVVAASKFGISIGGIGATGTVVTGNFIGTNFDGTISDPDGQSGNSDDFGNGKGILINDAPGAMITNNVIAGSNARGTDFGYGIQFANPNASGGIVKGNKIGVNATGTARLGNKSDGIFIERASNITIGGTSAPDRNIISGNGGDGVTIFGNAANPASNHVILGNYIGVDATGELDFGNKFRGVHIDSTSANNVVGGDSPGARNIISGNDSDGIIIALAGAENNVIKGNYIGTDKDGVSGIPNGGSGILILNAKRNRIGESSGTSFVRNVISANALHGVRIQGDQANDNVVAGNFIGTDKEGLAALPNTLHGVHLFNAGKNRIGDVFAGLPSNANFPGNVIAAIEDGIRIEGNTATQNQVLSNLIGVDKSGTIPWPSQAKVGVHIVDATINRIGVPSPASSTPGGNTIANNVRGIHIQGPGSTGTGTLGAIIGGNFIGTDSTGSLPGRDNPLANRLEGVFIENSSNNYVGGQVTGEPELPSNIIAANGGDGVRVTGDASAGNSILGNKIFANGLLGIDLGGNGLTPNDELDQDPGPNEYQNAPFVAPVVRSDGRREIFGSISSKPNTRYRIELFTSQDADPSRYGEGQSRVGVKDNVTTNSAGLGTFTFEGSLVLPGQVITATATGPTGATSEFSCATSQPIATNGGVFGVTHTNNAGSGSLRQAILDANSFSGSDTIMFCLAGEGPHTVVPTSALPAITDPVVIDGTTQPGASCNTQTNGGLNTKLQIQLDGSNAGTGSHGLQITAGNSTVRGLAINRFNGSGIFISGAGANQVECNFIGTDLVGASISRNLLDGITIDRSPLNLLGGVEPDKWNLISGNQQSGMAILGSTATSNRILGNYIGVNAQGTAPLSNATGIRIADASENVVGGAVGNVISGNGQEGVLLVDTLEVSGTATNNVVLGNRIGTNSAGTSPLPNQIGVRILDAGNNRVGGSPPNSTDFFGNLISGNSQFGVVIAGIAAANNVVAGNLIGTDASGNSPLANTTGVRIADASDNVVGGAVGNVISGNGQEGVFLVDTLEVPGTAANNIVLGNRIGTNSAGTSPVPNQIGVRILDTGNNRLGGSPPNSTDFFGNLISGNSQLGVVIAGIGAANNVVAGNLIGTDASGKQRLPNLLGGVSLGSDSAGNQIGGSTARERNIISGNNADGIRISGVALFPAHDNKVIGNYIGTDIEGKAALPNGQAPNNLASGIRIAEHAANNLIGGATSGERNVISGNTQHGVFIDGPDAKSNRIRGNYIGTDAAGTARLGNSASGVFASNSPSNRIGGDSAGQGNLISANQHGIRLEGVNAQSNIIESNLIGTNFQGSIGPDPLNAPLHNTGHGIWINQGSMNRIGLTSNSIALCNAVETPSNVIAGNRSQGIRIEGDQANENAVTCNSIHDNGHLLGQSGHGIEITAGTKNSVRVNSIYDNAGRGIDLGNDGITINGFGDDDKGANELQDYPVVTGVQFGKANNTTTWTLNSAADTKYLLDVYSNELPDPSGFGEGKTHLFTVELTTNKHGNGSVDVLSNPASRFLSATVTDPDGNTSEFSMIDTDGDALADAWETQNKDHNGDGIVSPWERGTFDLNEDGVNDHVTALFLPGADPNHKDLFVEVDTMLEAAGGPGLAQPSQADLNIVATGRAGQNDGFANAPNALVRNPDSKNGITLHAILSDTNVPNQVVSDGYWPEFDPIKTQFFGNPAVGATPDERGGPNSDQILAAKRLAYRYALFADQNNVNGVSGRGELPEDHEIPFFGGNDFVITLGRWNPRGGTLQQQLGTFMHELGHTLALRHGGGDHILFKPNYHSVMNYTWQTPNAATMNSWSLNYSDQTFPSLNESNLIEQVGIGGHPGHLVRVGPVPATAVVENGPVDWNRDNDFVDPLPGAKQVARDINRLFGNTPASPDEALHGYEDWSNIRYYFLESKNGSADGVHSQSDDDELSHETFLKLNELGVPKDLAVTVSTSANPVPVGGELTYTLRAKNNGQSTAYDVFLNDSLPATTTYLSGTSSRGVCDFAQQTVSCNLGALDAGAEVVVTIKVTVNSIGLINNTATIQGNEPDPNSPNNTASVTTAVGSDISVDRFSTTNSAPTELSVSYSISGSAVPQFEIAFFNSGQPTNHPAAIEVGTRIVITNPLDRTPGSHTISVNQPVIGDLIGNLDTAFVLAVADFGRAIEESDESNNDQYFVGAFHRTNDPRALVVRGRDSGGRNPISADKIIATSAGNNLSVDFNNQTTTVARTSSTQLAILGLGGDDSIELDITIPFVIHGGPGHDSLKIIGSAQHLNLVTLPNQQLTGIESIDITGAGPNQLTLDAAEVVALVGAGNSLTVLSDFGDSVNIGSGWKISGTQVDSGNFVRRLDQGTARLLLSGPADWQNPANPLDVNANGSVEPLDVLLIINELNVGRFHDRVGLLTVAVQLTPFPNTYFDSSGDRFVTPLDALLIINFLNRQVSGEGEQGLLVDRDAAFADTAWLELEFDERPQVFKRSKRANRFWH